MDNDSKNKENGPFLPREALIYLKTFCFYCYWAEKESIHNVLRHCRLAKSNQFLHTHTHTDIVVLFFRLRPLPLKHFLCLLCLFVSLVLVFYWVCLYFHDRAERRPSRVNFIWTSQWICVHVSEPLWCLFPFEISSTLISLRSEILNVQGFKKKTFYRSRSRSSLDFGLICSLIGQLHISGVTQTHTCWRGTFVKFAAPPVCLDLWILMSSASSVYT